MIENSNEARARDLMTEDPICCLPSDSLATAARLMRNNDCGALPVVESHDDGRAIGIITDRDITVRGIAENMDPATAKVESCMSHEICSVSPDSSLRDVELAMEKHKVRRILVTDEGDKVLGVISQAQVVRHAKPDEVAELLAAISEPS